MGAMKNYPIIIAAIALSLALGGAPSPCRDVQRAGQRAPPRHLEWAVKLLEVSPATTSYRHRNTSVRWKGVNSATASECHTDCSGLLSSLLRRAYGLTKDDLNKWLGRRRPVASTYYEAIKKQNQFRRLARLEEVRPGDVIAIKYDKDKNAERNTGHIMLVVAAPKRRTASAPLVSRTQQWEVTILDASRSGHGKSDTRRKRSGGFSPGLGRGTFRLYTNKAGAVVGHSWSTFPKSVHHSQADRPLVIGRLVLPRKR
jgi:hypothetical protein